MGACTLRVPGYQLYKGGQHQVDESAYVVNLRRNLQIFGGGVGTEEEKMGGHVVVSGGRAYVDSVEMFRMGQMGKMVCGARSFARWPLLRHTRSGSRLALPLTP